MKENYNKSIFLFIILVLMVLIAYTIVSLMGNEDVSVVDSMSSQIETVIDN